jgi:hypothetical protein
LSKTQCDTQSITDTHETENKEEKPKDDDKKLEETKEGLLKDIKVANSYL